MATQEEIYNKTKDVLINEFEAREETVTMQTNLYTDLDLDSLDVIDLMVTLDKELGIEVKTEEMRDINTVEDVCNFVLSFVPTNK